MYFIWLLIGIFMGSLITNLIYLSKRTYGTLRIDHSDPLKDIYRFEINKFEDLSKKKRIELKIDNDADLSQK